MPDQAIRATGSSAEAEALMEEINLKLGQGTVCWGADEWFVIIFESRKKPPVTMWLDCPVTYHIGGGMPRALGELGEAA
jgi:hypothetical protein